MDLAGSFAALSFRKVLKGFEIGGLPYTDVQFHLHRLLAAGAPPDELQEVLRRCELITPLPDYAHAEVLRVIEEAKQQAANQALNEVPAPSSEESAMGAMREALEAEQIKSRDISKALAERIAYEQASRARGEEARRDLDQVQSELRGARHGISDRDAVIAQMRASLDESHARIADLQKGHEDARAHVETELNAVRSRAVSLEVDLGAARTAAETLQREVAQHAAEISTLRESLAAREKSSADLQKGYAEAKANLEAELNAARSRAVLLEADLGAARAAVATLQAEAAQKAAEILSLRESRASEEKLSAELKRTVAERDAVIARQASLDESHVRIVGASERNAQIAQALEVDLQSARRRSDALERELSASRESAAPLRAERDSLRAQLAGLQSKLRDNESLVASLQQSVRNDARRVAELQAAALPQAPAMAREIAAPELWAAVPAPRGKPPTRAAVIGVGAAIIALAVMVWAFMRHTPPPVVAPVAAAAVPNPGTVLRDCQDCPAFTVLPAGRFDQGSAPAAAGAATAAGAFDKPLHAVAISYSFAMSTNTVTVDEFRAFATATGRNQQGCDIYDGDWRHRADVSWESPGFVQGGSHPVTCVSWNDANAYAAWLSAKTGHHYRLPSASEWEYAARSGGTAVQSWTAASGACAGANVADQSAARRFPGWTVFGCDDGYVFTAPVGTFKPNGFGLNDMLGNVFQWTEDCWHADYAGAPVDGSARTDGDCSQRELRGGSWFSTPAYVRANYRNHFAADYRTSSVGIRLVRELDS